jgi:hypothetical protein
MRKDQPSVKASVTGEIEPYGRSGYVFWMPRRYSDFVHSDFGFSLSIESNISVFTSVFVRGLYSNRDLSHHTYRVTPPGSPPPPSYLVECAYKDSYYSALYTGLVLRLPISKLLSSDNILKLCSHDGISSYLNVGIGWVHLAEIKMDWHTIGGPWPGLTDVSFYRPKDNLFMELGFGIEFKAGHFGLFAELRFANLGRPRRSSHAQWKNDTRHSKNLYVLYCESGILFSF